MIQIETWHLISLAITLVAAFAGLLKLLMTQQASHIDAAFIIQGVRLDKIEAANLAEANSWQRVEREFLSFKAELPISYVRREDYIRGQSVLESKLDSLAIKIENAHLRSLYRAQNQPGESK